MRPLSSTPIIDFGVDNTCNGAPCNGGFTGPIRPDKMTTAPASRPTRPVKVPLEPEIIYDGARFEELITETPTAPTWKLLRVSDLERKTASHDEFFAALSHASEFQFAVSSFMPSGEDIVE